MKLKRSPAARFLWQPQVYDLVMFDIRRYSREEALEFYEQIRAAGPTAANRLPHRAPKIPFEYMAQRCRRG